MIFTFKAQVLPVRERPLLLVAHLLPLIDSVFRCAVAVFVVQFLLFD